MISWKERFENFIAREWKFLIAVVVIIAIAILLVIGSPWLKNQFTESNTKVVVQPALSCADLSTQSQTLVGTPPIAPSFTVKLAGIHLSNQPICQWYIDGAYSHSSFPLGNECVFSKKQIILGGNYKVTLSIVDSNSLIPADSNYQVPLNGQLSSNNVIIKNINKYRATTCSGEKIVKIDSSIGKVTTTNPGIQKESSGSEVIVK